MKKLIGILIVLFFSAAYSQENGAEPPPPQEPVENPVPAAPVPVTYQSERNQYHGLLIGYWISPLMKMDATATQGTASGSGSFEFQMKSGLNIGYEWSQFKRQSWNNGILVDYVSVDFDEAKIKDSTSTTTVSVPGRLSILTVSYSGKYRWEEFYLPLGAGLASSSVSGNDGLLTKSIKTPVVFWIGVGFTPSEKIALELVSKAYSVTASTVTSNGTTLKPDPGTIAGLQINLKVLF